MKKIREKERKKNNLKEVSKISKISEEIQILN